MRRAPLSLLNHLHEVHCARLSIIPPALPSTPSQQIVSTQQQQQPQQASLISVNGSKKPSLLKNLHWLQPSGTTSAGAKVAAAAKAENQLRAQLQSDFFPLMKEGPVTKHVRLTAALILYNMATYSPLARRSVDMKIALDFYCLICRVPN